MSIRTVSPINVLVQGSYDNICILLLFLRKYKAISSIIQQGTSFIPHVLLREGTWGLPWCQPLQLVMARCVKSVAEVGTLSGGFKLVGSS